MSLLEGLRIGSGGRGISRLLAQGELLPARIDAIHAASGTCRWGLLVRRPDGSEFRAGVRQRPPGPAAGARLGAAVLVRHRAGRVLIDWPATLAAAGTPDPGAISVGRPLRRPPEPGIEDARISRRRLAHGRLTQAIVVTAAQAHERPFCWRLRLRLGARELVLESTAVPPYAVHLMAPGTDLPVAIDRKHADRVEIDWASAAESDAARGR